jgi:hypothetical protein
MHSNPQHHTPSSIAIQSLWLAVRSKGFSTLKMRTSFCNAMKRPQQEHIRNVDRFKTESNDQGKRSKVDANDLQLMRRKQLLSSLFCIGDGALCSRSNPSAHAFGFSFRKKLLHTSSRSPYLVDRDSRRLRASSDVSLTRFSCFAYVSM